MKRPRWACCDVLSVLLLWLAFAGAALAGEEATRLTEAEFVLGEGDTPPSDGADWQPVTLPEAWWRAHPGVTGDGWYRLRWELAARPAAAQAIYLPKLGRVGDVYMNGRLVGRHGTLEQPELFTRPQLHAVDQALLREGRNTIHLRLRTTTKFSGVVAAPLVGAAAALQPAFALRNVLTWTAPQLLFGVAFVLGGFMLVLAAKRPNERTLGRFGIASLMYCLFLLDWVLVVPPIELGNWSAVRGFALQGINVATLSFALSYGGWRLPRLTWALWATVPAIALFYWLDSHDVAVPGWIWHVQTVSILAYIGTFGLIAWRERSVQSMALFLASFGCFLDAIANHVGVPLEMVSLFPYSFLLLFMLTGLILVNRFARSLGEAESLNSQLEQRVEGKRVELEHNHERLRLLEKQQAVAAERQRIMSDMHDGIGGQLISTLSLVEHGQASTAAVAAALRECIDDLRLVIDSLEPADEDLLPVLGNLRYRLEGRLAQRGISLDWQVHEVPRLTCLTPQNLLHVLRILQEAFTNILKHAGATRIRVGTSIDGAHVAITVADDGRGFSASAAPGGHGLANMSQRARTIGGELRILPLSQGTQLSLLLPIA